MQFYKYTDQAREEEIRGLIKQQAFCRLVTISAEGRPRIGLFNHATDGSAIILHLNKRDEQLADLRVKPRALVSFEDFLTTIPSYWVDGEDASFATMYYRYAEFDCAAEILDTPEAMLPCFQSLLDRHQPEGGYAKLDPSIEMYRSSFAMLAIVVLRPAATRTKWKVAQNRTPEQRRHIIAKLRERAQGSDLRAADEMEKTL